MNDHNPFNKDELEAIYDAMRTAWDSTLNHPSIHRALERAWDKLPEPDDFPVQPGRKVTIETNIYQHPRWISVEKSIAGKNYIKYFPKTTRGLESARAYLHSLK